MWPWGEYDNTRFHDLFHQNGIHFRFSCPRTSQQNGKSERMLRTVNSLIRTLLFQAKIPPSYWVEALNMAAHLLNILPSTAINNEIPYTKLHNQTLPMNICVFLDVFAILTSRLNINFNPVPHLASFLVTPQTTVAIGVSTYHQIR